MAVSLTEKAANEVKRIIKEQNLPESAVLRMGVRGGGCSGFEYSLGFDAEANPTNDEISEAHGVKIAIDKRSQLYLANTEVDYYESIEKRGFTFNNPNATKTCGCGTSFSV